ncbi:hypothetical protein ACFY15_22295 [Streptomyces sp. NPDC001373]|uniref:hypothetical protein n=2 Tax=unclassified Streptomyces TaxID=2593676 RepID=UPI0036A45F60
MHGESIAGRRAGWSAGRIVALAADAVALIIIVWIAMDLLGANRSNDVVQWFHDAATWLAGWSLDIFHLSRHWAQVIVGYGIAAVVYLVAGHALARLLSRA